MSTYGLEQVIKMWAVEQLTAEQAIGQILQLIREDRERMKEIERRLREVERREASRRVSGRQTRKLGDNDGKIGRGLPDVA